MEYREIVAVTGLGGLFHLLATKADGAIVRNLSDKTTKFISARTHNVTPLESIEIYTTGDNVRLHNIFEKMQEHEATTPLADARTADNDTIKGYFKGIYPEIDEERVYVSDMKKMLKWYELLKANDLLHFEQPEEPVTEAEPTEEAKEEKEEQPAEKPAKKAKKNSEPDEMNAVEEEPKPKKVARKKKEAAEGEAAETPKKTAKKKKTEE